LTFSSRDGTLNSMWIGSLTPRTFLVLALASGTTTAWAQNPDTSLTGAGSPFQNCSPHNVVEVVTGPHPSYPAARDAGIRAWEARADGQWARANGRTFSCRQSATGVPGQVSYVCNLRAAPCY
jgi:hypothetical protein